MTVTLHVGDCREALASMPDASVDSIVTDPPYELGFMGKTWDSSGIAYDAAMWAECLRVLKPGGHLLAFGGTRTYHRMTVAIEDAGFEIRDSIHWIYGSGFPKSLDVSKAIDKAAGATREVIGRGTSGIAKGSDDRNFEHGKRARTYDAATEFDITAPATPEAAAWSGWGTALKPAHEPIVVARKPLVGTVAANVLAHGTGGLNIDGCRVGDGEDRTGGGVQGAMPQPMSWGGEPTGRERPTGGRWPANVVLDEAAAAELDAQSGTLHSQNPATRASRSKVVCTTGFSTGKSAEYGDTGGASRFFYCAKAGTKERPVGPDGTKHATVKPLALMRWLVRLVTPPGGTVLDPFAGSGTTLEAAILEGFDSVGIERDPAHADLCAIRVERSGGQWALPPGWAA